MNRLNPFSFAAAWAGLAIALAPSVHAAENDGPRDNGGILNGPLTDTNLGHRAQGEGDRESLRWAIEHLMAEFGERYPGGPDFLQRLEDGVMADPASDEFKNLQREALVEANPAIDFDRILLVRARKGAKRHSSNWQTRVDCQPQFVTFQRRDLERVLGVCVRQDGELRALLGEQRAAESAYEAAEKALQKRAHYRQAEEKLRRRMLRELPEHAALTAAREALHRHALQHEAYAEAHGKLGTDQAVFDDELIALDLRGGRGTETIYRPATGKFIGDIDLHFQADRLLFTTFVDRGILTEAPGTGKGYGVFELAIDPDTGRRRGEPAMVSPDFGSDVDCYDACYLPDGRIIFASTAAYEGVPCVGGKSYVANLYRMDRDGSGVRRLTFDQDGNWHPMVMENGRVMYTRWEYTDSAHYFSRILMTMNPDGTDQKAWYGSNSYWPNSLFYSRQIPGKPHEFLSVVTGHHDVAKGGALVLFDVTRGRHEAEGAVQFITGRGVEVRPLVLDKLTEAYGPIFFDSFPIDDTFFLAIKDEGLWLLDRFDNMVCLQPKDGEGGYFNPVPLRITPTPPALPDQIQPGEKEATVLINDIYAGPGLRGVPRGQVKGIRVYRYEYGPRYKGGHYDMGMEAGWDAKQVLGMAPVERDGSVSFKVPANTPFAMQPVDAEGRALQLMRSWTVAMPGERLSCIGCHESQDMAPPAQRYAAMLREPSALEPFYGPTRGFSFPREIQPVLDRHCVSCHDGDEPRGRYSLSDRIIGTGENTGKIFSECGIPDLSEAETAHRNLHPFVRRNGPEGDYHLLTPLEFHASTSELVQMLEKGHHHVNLDREAWDRLYTWIDLNAPFHGTWTEAGADEKILARRLELRRRYAGDDYDPEKIVNPYRRSGESILPEPYPDGRIEPVAPEVGAVVAQRENLDLGGGVSLPLVPIPAGEFSMGANDETPWERPVSRVTIEDEFLMGATEVTLAQYRQFDPDYLNGVYDMHYKDQVHRGYYMNDLDFPVIRVTWENAMEFCEWLSRRTGRRVSLPTEAQWEWACRAGQSTPLSFGGIHTPFSEHANLADVSLKLLAVKGVDPQPIPNPDPSWAFEPKDPRSDDGVLHLAEVGRYHPNPWGLFDMHGNVSEWTRSEYRPYPYVADDGRNEEKGGRKVVRGGSWFDRPQRATASYRLGYPAWQRVFNTGFRVVVEG